MSSVYVGTYRKYNDGSIKGDWLDLEDYDSKADFYEASGGVLNKALPVLPSHPASRSS
jgi:antirestriction protein